MESDVGSTQCGQCGMGKAGFPTQMNKGKMDMGGRLVFSTSSQLYRHRCLELFVNHLMSLLPHGPSIVPVPHRISSSVGPPSKFEALAGHPQARGVDSGRVSHFDSK